MIKIGIVGSRNRTSENEKNKIRQILLSQLKKGRQLHLVSGGCKSGADLFAEQLSQELKLSISIHSPDLEGLSDSSSKWQYVERYYDRNQKIADEADILIALPREDFKGGTVDTIKRVEALNKPIIIL